MDLSLALGERMVRHPADWVRVNPRELLLKMSKLQAQSSGLPMNLIECERNKPSRNQQMPRVASIRKCPHSNGPIHRITQITITAIFRQCALAHKGHDPRRFAQPNRVRRLPLPSWISSSLRRDPCGPAAALRQFDLEFGGFGNLILHFRVVTAITIGIHTILVSFHLEAALWQE